MMNLQLVLIELPVVFGITCFAFGASVALLVVMILNKDKKKRR